MPLPNRIETRPDSPSPGGEQERSKWMHDDIPGEPDLEDQRGEQQKPQTENSGAIHSAWTAVMSSEHEMKLR
jgi:hypothetical protein